MSKRRFYRSHGGFHAENWKKKTEKAQKASQVVYIDKTLFNKAGRVCVFQAVAENVLHGLRRRVKKFFRGKV